MLWYNRDMSTEETVEKEAEKFRLTYAFAQYRFSDYRGFGQSAFGPSPGGDGGCSLIVQQPYLTPTRVSIFPLLA